MTWLLHTSMRFGRLVIAAVLGLLILGLAQFGSAKVDVYPEFMPPSVQVQTEALGLSAAEVEQLITVPLEQDLLNGVPWLDRTHSRSQPGLSAIDLVFEPGTDIYAARQMVQERLTQAHALPNVGSPPIMIEPLASASRVAMIGLSSKSVSLIDMSVLARWKIRPRLMGIPGVANVGIYGQRDRQLQVQVDPQRLGRSDVTLTQVIETAGNALWVSPLTFVEASTPGTGGFVESGNQRLAVQHVLPITTPQQLAAVPVEGTAAGSLRLGDVATVVEDHQPLIGDALVRDAPSLFLVVQKYPEANTLQVSRAIEEAMAGLQPGLAGITVSSSVYRPATFIQTAVHNVALVALLGLVLLTVIALAMFSSWRAALVSLVAVPVSLVAAMYVLYLRGETFTTMTLAGLAVALALLIDDATGDVHLIRRRLREAPDGTGSATSTVIRACLELRSTLAFATLIVLLATVPLLVMSRLTTAFTAPAVLSYALAVLASLLVSLTVTPTLAALLLPASAGPSRPRPPAAWVQRAFDRGVLAVLRRSWPAWLAAGALALGLLAAIPQLGRGPVLPAMQDRDLLLRVQAVPGTSLREMDRITGVMSRELRDLPGVRDVGVHVGRAITSDQVVNVNSGELWVDIDDAADYGRTRRAITSVVAGYPGLRTSLLSYPSDRLADAARGDGHDLVVRLFGQDLDALRATANSVQTAIAAVPGVVSPAVEPLVTEPTARIEVDLAAAQRHGLKPGDIRRDATTLTSGLIVGNLYEQAKIFDVVVLGDPATRANLTTLGDLLLDTPAGGQVRLRDVAAVRVQPEPTAIVHNDVFRTVDVVASLRGRDASAVVADVRSRVAGIPMPAEAHLQVLGDATAAQADAGRVLEWSLGVLVAIYLLMQAAVASWRRAALLLLAVPLACAGGVLAAPLAGGLRSAGALAGLFAVAALSVRGGLVLARRIRALEALEDAAADGDGRDAVLEATRERVLPVVHTALAIAVVLIPVLVLGERPGLEILRPMAVTVLGGLVTSTLVTLFVLPALCRVVRPRWPGPSGQVPEQRAEAPERSADVPAPV